MLINSKRLARDGGLVDLEEGILGDDATVGGDDCTLFARSVSSQLIPPCGGFKGSQIPLQAVEYHRERPEELRSPATAHYGGRQL